MDNENQAAEPNPVHGSLDHAIRLREATPGRPEDGPYPASVDEVADEVVIWLRELDRTAARGVAREVLQRLTPASQDQAPAEPNPELAATGACVTALEALDAAQQANVLRFLGARFGNFVAPVGFVEQMAGRTVRRLVGHNRPV